MGKSDRGRGDGKIATGNTFRVRSQSAPAAPLGRKPRMPRSVKRVRKAQRETEKRRMSASEKKKAKKARRRAQREAQEAAEEEESSDALVVTPLTRNDGARLKRGRSPSSGRGGEDEADFVLISSDEEDAERAEAERRGRRRTARKEKKRARRRGGLDSDSDGGGGGTAADPLGFTIDRVGRVVKGLTDVTGRDEGEGEGEGEGEAKAGDDDSAAVEVPEANLFANTIDKTINVRHDADRYFEPRREDKAIVCRRCGEEGHMGRDCTNAATKQPCFLCGGVGHISRLCPSQRCWKCFGTGHQVRACKHRGSKPFFRYLGAPPPARPPGGATPFCSFCGSRGHGVLNCQQKRRRSY